MKAPVRAVALLAALLIAANAVPAYAQKKGLVGALLGAGAGAAKASSGKKSYGPDTLKPEALKSCLIAAHDLDEGEPKRTAEKKKLEAESAWLDKEEGSLKASAKKPAVDQAEVDRHRARVDAYKKRLAVYNKSVDEYNATLDKDKAARTRFNSGCAGKSYYPSDLATIQPQLPFSTAEYTTRK